MPHPATSGQCFRTSSYRERVGEEAYQREIDVQRDPCQPQKEVLQVVEQFVPGLETSVEELDRVFAELDRLVADELAMETAAAEEKRGAARAAFRALRKWHEIEEAAPWCMHAPWAAMLRSDPAEPPPASRRRLSADVPEAVTLVCPSEVIDTSCESLGGA